jgi:hypothetical protein
MSQRLYAPESTSHERPSSRPPTTPVACNVAFLAAMCPRMALCLRAVALHTGRRREGCGRHNGLHALHWACRLGLPLGVKVLGLSHFLGFEGT